MDNELEFEHAIDDVVKWWRPREGTPGNQAV